MLVESANNAARYKEAFNEEKTRSKEHLVNWIFALKRRWLLEEDYEKVVKDNKELEAAFERARKYQTTLSSNKRTELLSLSREIKA